MARRLGQKQIDEFRTAFVAQQNAIYNTYKEKKQDEKASVDCDGDETDVVQGILISSIEEKLSIRDAQKLKKINDAIGRINAGTFGVCEDCEGLIGKARLLARPEAELCITCAEKAEKNAKNFIRK